MNAKREAEWKEAQRRCRLSDEALRMARQMGLNPRKLIKNRPNRHEPWKAPVEDWIRDIYCKRFGDRKPEAKLAKDSKTGQNPVVPKTVIPAGPDRSAAAPASALEATESSGDTESGIGPNLLEEAEREIDARLRRGEIDVDELGTALWEMDRDTPVSEGEIAQQNHFMLNRYKAFRLAAERVAASLSELPIVQKVVLFGSVAAPPRKEVPRFRRLRRAKVAIWHECNDIDLAVWVTDLSALSSLKKAAIRGLQDYEKAVQGKPFPGVPNHQLDIFLFEPDTGRFRGNLCQYGACPKGKIDCEVTGCGAQPFLRLYEDFKFDRGCLFSEHNLVLFERRTETLGPTASGSTTDPDEIPF